jgi:hypothetical protein
VAKRRHEGKILPEKMPQAMANNTYPILFILNVILPLRAMSVLAFYRSANHWLSDERLSEERNWKSKK